MTQAHTGFSRRLVLSLLFLSFLTGGFAASVSVLTPQAQADDCPNAQFREGASAHLPDCRAYEMVSPADKNGGDIAIGLQARPDGNRIGFYSTSGFAGAAANYIVSSYRAERTGSGWTTTPMNPPVGYPLLGPLGAYGPVEFTSDLSTAFLMTRSGASEPMLINVFATDAGGATRWITAPTVAGVTPGNKTYAGSSADGTHVFFESDQDFVPGLPPAQPYQLRIWEWFDGSVRLVSYLPDGSVPTDPALIGSGANANLDTNSFFGSFPEPFAVSTDGQRVFFTAQGGHLYVREGGTSTREVSLSARSGSVGQSTSNPVVFAGAASDGSRVYFMSGEQLTDDATPGGGLYMLDLRPGGVLQFVSAGSTDPGGAQVSSVPLVSQDGSAAYFIAGGQLVPGKGTPGGQNLYLADGDGVAYIATLGADDSQDWDAASTGGWTSTRTVRATPDGRKFLFQSDVQQTSFDNAGHTEIYLFDAAARSLKCVSCGPGGHVAAGDASLLPDPIDPISGQPRVPSTVQYGHPRNITDDGSRIYFETTDPLVSGDLNNLEDVYEYRDGKVSLISAGTGGYDSELADITPDGGSVYFVTRDSLVGRDIDGGAIDLYVARIGGGFSDPPVVDPCSGEGCQPPGSKPPTPDSPVSGASPGDPEAPEVRAARVLVRSITSAGRKTVLKTGKLTLVVSADLAGTVTARGRASFGDHRGFSIRSAKASVRKGGTVSLHVSLPSAVRRALERHHRVRLWIDVTHNKATRPAHVALTLR